MKFQRNDQVIFDGKVYTVRSYSRFAHTYILQSVEGTRRADADQVEALDTPDND